MFVFPRVEILKNNSSKTLHKYIKFSATILNTCYGFQ